MRSTCMLGIVLLACGLLSSARGQSQPRGSRNVTVVAHLAPEELSADGGALGDVVLEQEPGRPFAYVARRGGTPAVVVVGLASPEKPQVLSTWTPAGPGTAHTTDVDLFKIDDRFYLVQASTGGDDGDAAVVVDVTGLPDVATMEEVARIDVEGGLIDVFPYRHSDGRTLLFATGGSDALVFDAAGVIAGRTQPIATIAAPEVLGGSASGFQSVFAAFHPESQQDRLYAAGAGGYHVIDVTDIEHATVVTSVEPAAVRDGRFVAPTPDGRYLVTSATYRTAPIRIFDLEPALAGRVPQVRTAIGAWTANWRNVAHRFEVRWPFVFVAALEDGFQTFDMRAAYQPYTTAYYHTHVGAPPALNDPFAGAWDVDVRNADGLVAVTDAETGLWLLSVEGFQGWDGRGWGVPNASSVQDWDHGPDGAVNR